MRVNLVVAKGPAVTRTVRLKVGETIIGRSRDCDLCIPSSDVSRRHCLVAFADGQVTVEDLSSANGTFLNDKHITGIQPVQSGDELRIGPITFNVQIEGKRSEPEIAMEPAKPAGAKAPPNRPAIAPTAPEMIDVVPLQEDAEPPQATPPPPTKKQPAAKAESPSQKPTPPNKEEKKPAEDEGEEAINADDLSWDLPAGKDFRDLLNEMSE